MEYQRQDGHGAKLEQINWFSSSTGVAGRWSGVTSTSNPPRTRRDLASHSTRLERDGYLLRSVHPMSPPMASYELNERGRSLLVPIRGLLAWARKTRGAIDASRAAYDRQADQARHQSVSAGTVTRT